MPGKGKDNTIDIDIDTKNIISINFLTYSDQENMLHGKVIDLIKADPTDGRFLFLWFLKDNKLTLVRKPTSMGDISDMINDSTVKVDIKYAQNCVSKNK